MSLTILETAPPVDPMTKAGMIVKDLTLGTAMMNVVGGYCMGFLLSLFGAFIAADTASQAMGTADFFKHNVRAASRLGGSFAFFGLLFGGMEVAMEKRRGRKDMWNPSVSGGLIGGYYGWRSYRSPGLVGGVVAGTILSALFEKLLAACGFDQR